MLLFCLPRRGGQRLRREMVSFAVIFAAVAPVFFLVALGAGLRRAGFVPPALDAALLRLVVCVFYPSLILRTTLGNPALAEPANVWLPPVLGFICVSIGFAVSWWLAPLFGLKVGTGRRTFAFGVGVFNYGYLPIPLATTLFPGGETTGVLLVFNVGVEVAFWTIGIMLVSGGFNRSWWRKALSPPIIALLIGLLLTVTGLYRWAPSFLVEGIGLLGRCAVPLGLMLTGAALMDLAGDKGLMARPLVPLGAVGLRLAALPLAILALAKFAPGLTDELRAVIVIQSAMPAAMFPVIVGKHYGNSPRVAVQVVLATTVVSLVTIPAWLAWGLSWVKG